MSEEVEQLLAELDRAHNLLEWIKSISDHQLIIHQRLEQLAFRNLSRIRHELNTKGYDTENRNYGSACYTQHTAAIAHLSNYNVQVAGLSARLDKTTNRDFMDVETENIYLKARNAQLETMLKERSGNDGS